MIYFCFLKIDRNHLILDWLFQCCFLFPFKWMPHYVYLGHPYNDQRRPLPPALRPQQRKMMSMTRRETEETSEDDSEEKDCGDTRILDVLSDVQEFLGHLNSEELSTGVRDMKQTLASRIDFVTRRSKSKSRWIETNLDEDEDYRIFFCFKGETLQLSIHFGE